MDANSIVKVEARKKVLILNAHHWRDRIQKYDELNLVDRGVPLAVVEDEKPANERDNPHAYWMWLVRKIAEQYTKYDGFIIMQGIDTMTNTAAIVAFLLENLGKPVVLTGTVSEPGASYSDLRRNFLLAMLFAGGALGDASDCCEVVIVFAEKVFRGTRALLESTSSLQPFSSPKFAPLGVMHGHTLIADRSRYRSAPTGPLIAHTEVELPEILLLMVTMSLTREAVFRLVSNSRAKALVIQAFGAGNVPYRDKTIEDVAKFADERGMVVVVISQVRRGSVELGVYYTSGPLSRFAVSAGDMTVDSTVAKLKYLLGRRRWSKNDIKALMTVDLRGELTEDLHSSKL